MIPYFLTATLKRQKTATMEEMKTPWLQEPKMKKRTNNILDFEGFGVCHRIRVLDLPRNPWRPEVPPSRLSPVPASLASVTTAPSPLAHAPRSSSQLPYNAQNTRPAQTPNRENLG